MTLKNKAISSLFWVFVQQFSIQILAFVVSIILARILLPEDFGLIAMLAIIMGVAATLVEGGMSSSLIRTEKPDNEDYSTVFYFNLIVSFILYSIAFLTAKPIAIFYNTPLLESITKWYALIFVINAFSNIQLTILQKKMLFKKEMLIKLPSLLLSSVIGIIMAYSGYGVWALVVSAIAQSFFLAVQLWIISDWRPKFVFNKKKFHNHFHFGYKLTISYLLEVIFKNAYIIIIGKYFAPAQVGFYFKADNLKQLPVNNISSILNKVTFPLFAKVKDDNIRLKLMYKKILQTVIFLVAPILLIMSALGEPLFRFLFTDKWLPAVPYFQILCWAGILYPIHAYNLTIIKVKGRSDLFLKLEIFKKIILVFFIILTLPFGIKALLIGSVLFSLVAFFINSFYTGKFIDYSAIQQSKDLLPTVVLAIIASGMVYIADKYYFDLHFDDLIRIVLGSIIGSIIYLFLSIILKLNAIFEIKTIIKSFKKLQNNT